MSCNAVAVACVAADPATEGATTDRSSDGPDSAASEPNVVTPVCSLEQSNDHPKVSIRGQVCGETVDYSSLAGRSMHFGRATTDEPENEIRVISVKDDPQHGNTTDEAYFDEFGFVLNLGFHTGPAVDNGVSTHSLLSGLFASCDFGTLVFAEAPVNFAIEGIGESTNPAQVRLTLSGLIVRGYSERYALDAVPLCGGEVDIILEGPFQQR